MTRAGLLARLAAAWLVCAGAAAGADDNDLRDLRLGLPVGDIPAEEYIELACAAPPHAALSGWQQYRTCPPDAAGLRAVAFEFNARLNPLAEINDKYEGTRVAGHPVALRLLIDEHGTVAGLDIDTDPQARLFWRKKAYLLAGVVKTRYGEEGWSCRDGAPEDGETAVGGLLVKRHCEKTANHRRLVLDVAVYRRSDQPPNDFVNETRLKIRRAGDGP